MANRHHDVRLVAAIALVATACASGGVQPTARTLEDAQRPLSELPISARISIPSSADWITFGLGSVWVVNYRPDRVSRIDGSTNRVTADIGIGPNGCLGIVEAIDRIWVATCGDGVMNEIDPKRDSVVRRIPLPIRRGREGAFAFVNGAFWVPDNVADSGSSTVAKVDARSGAVTAHVATGARSDVAIAGFGSVWVASSGENVVVRIDPERNAVVARIPVGGSPKFMAAGEGAIWVQNRSDGSVSRIDPGSNHEVARIEAKAPTRAGDIA